MHDPYYFHQITHIPGSGIFTDHLTQMGEKHLHGIFFFVQFCTKLLYVILSLFNLTKKRSNLYKKNVENVRRKRKLDAQRRLVHSVDKFHMTVACSVKVQWFNGVVSSGIPKQNN